MEMTPYAARRERLYDWMAQEGIGLAMMEDMEGRRNPGLRWLTGQPGDALLFLSADRRCALVPWDIHMAKLLADADVVIAYEEFQRLPIQAALGVSKLLKVPAGSKFEIPSITPYPLFLNFVEAMEDHDVLCRNGGLDEIVAALRAVKDEDELRILREASVITNDIMDLLEKEFHAGSLKTETDVALFIEAAARSRGCEGTSFETLAAGPSRSFGIHAFPSYTAEPFGTQGLSILDFGLMYRGYATDVTMTVARGPLSRTQQRMVTLVTKAHDLAVGLVGPGVLTRDIALAVDEIFTKAKKTMPHALGHGIGIEAHEAPAVRSRADNQWRLVPGMVITIEPGLYDPVHGGCRFEDDVLVTETGYELLTNSRIVKLD